MDTLLITESRAESLSYSAFPQSALVFIYDHNLHVWKQSGEANTFRAHKTSSRALHQYSITSLVFFHFSSEGTLCLALCLFSVLRTTKMSQAESSCKAGMSDLLQQVWKKRNVIYYSLFTSATITLQNQKENNVIERYMPSSLQKPQTASGKSQYRCSTRH